MLRHLLQSGPDTELSQPADTLCPAPGDQGRFDSIHILYVQQYGSQSIPRHAPRSGLGGRLHGPGLRFEIPVTGQPHATPPTGYELAPIGAGGKGDPSPFSAMIDTTKRDNLRNCFAGFPHHDRRHRGRLAAAGLAGDALLASPPDASGDNRGTTHPRFVSGA